MSTTWTQMTLVLLPVIVGAVIGVVPTMIVERARERAALRTRWDTTLHRSCAEFAASTRRILDLSEQADESPSQAREPVVEGLRREHSRLQVLMAEIRLVAGEEVQRAARLVVRHTWAVYLAVTVPRSDALDSKLLRGRVLHSLIDFYRSVRRQLMVPNADLLSPVNPPDPDRLPDQPDAVGMPGSPP